MLAKRNEDPRKRRWLKLLGYGILAVTVGVVSCQALLAASPPATDENLGRPPHGEARPAR